MPSWALMITAFSGFQAPNRFFTTSIRFSPWPRSASRLPRPHLLKTAMAIRPSTSTIWNSAVDLWKAAYETRQPPSSAASRGARVSNAGENLSPLICSQWKPIPASRW